MTSFLEYLQFQARSRPQAPAIMTLRATLSYEELMSRVRSVARYLTDNKLNSGDLLVIEPGRPDPALLRDRGGDGRRHRDAVSRGTPPGPAEQAVGQCNPDRSAGGNAPQSQIRVIRIPPTWLKDLSYETELPRRSGGGSQAPGPHHLHVWHDGRAESRPFHRRAARAARLGAGRRASSLRPGPSKTLGMMGVASGAGFTNMMLVLDDGGTLMLIPGMAQLARVSSLYKMDRILASTAQLIAMLRQQDNDNADFSGVKEHGRRRQPHSAIGRQTGARRFAATSSVSTARPRLVSSRPRPPRFSRNINRRSATWRPASSWRSSMKPENPSALIARASSASRCPGAPSRYLNDDEASRRVFRDGWFYPGDIGSLSADGLLYVSGRVAERINAGGVKVAPSVIEDVISTRPEISDVAAFEHINADGISEIAVAIVPHENIDRANFNRTELRQYFQKQLREKTPRRWIIVKEIPRSEQGKIDRAALQRHRASAGDPVA